MILLAVICSIVLLTYIERGIYLHFKRKGIRNWNGGEIHIQNLKRPVYGFYYRIYVDFKDNE